MKVVNGDLLEMAKNGDFDVIVHGCNCFCAMGAGIARQIRMEFPAAYIVDQQTLPGDKNKLGSCTFAVHTEPTISPFIVVNAYTQYMPGPNLDIDALRRCFSLVNKHFGERRIAYPKIGCGIAGGDWLEVSQIIDEELEGCDHTYVDFGL